MAEDKSVKHAQEQLGALGDAISGERPVDAATLTEVGHLAIDIVVLRTKSGLDVDRKPFAEYSSEYAATRAKLGLAKQVDLARTGHMLGGLVPTIDVARGEVSVGFLSATEAKKAAIHNDGFDAKSVTVKAHKRRDGEATALRKAQKSVDRARKSYHRSEGEDSAKLNRLMKAMERLDRVQKGKTRTKSGVSEHTRKARMPKREFLGIRAVEDIELIAEHLGVDIAQGLKKVFDK